MKKDVYFKTVNGVKYVVNGSDYKDDYGSYTYSYDAYIINEDGSYTYSYDAYIINEDGSRKIISPSCQRLSQSEAISFIPLTIEEIIQYKKKEIGRYKSKIEHLEQEINDMGGGVKVTNGT